MNIFRHRLSPAGFLLLAFYLLLFLYILFRAVHLSFTHDESLSFRILLGEASWRHTANDHWLNTFLMRCSRSLFGDGELALRLPNVLAFALYLVVIFLIVRRADHILLMLWGSALLLLDPFLLDFFSLARGYGLSLAFFLLSLYFVLLSVDDWRGGNRSLRHPSLALLSALPAVLANLSLINYLIAVLVLYLFFVAKGIGHRSRHRWYPILLTLGLSLAVLITGVRHLLWLSEHGQLYQGAATLRATLDSIILNALYPVSYPSWLFRILRTLAVILFFGGVLSLVVRSDPSGRFLVVTILLLMVLGGFVAEHILFRSPYPYGRSALFLRAWYGLFLFLFTLHLVRTYRIPPWLYRLPILLTILLMTTEIVSSANLVYTNTWRYDAHTREVMEIVKKRADDSGHPLTISNHWLFEPSINYYILSRKMNLRRTDRNGPSLSTDFIYQFDTMPSPPGFFSLQHYPDIGTRLFEKGSAYRQHP